MSALLSSTATSQFLFETLIWTGLLIGLVLVLRRPVARYLGPKAAYALWLLPFLRLLMPPLVLPAWLAPAPVVQPISETTVYLLDDAASGPMADAAMAADAPIAWATIFTAIWLTGALVFLAMRFNAYFGMRRDFLAEGSPVGEAGAVRLVETPAATAPVAFGVLDKVIALPPAFMALEHRDRRDLALAHELAHHSAHDLLANMAAQFLFALHWFNPLSWMGWRAMRRDQEAACDARVIAQQGEEHKATYAAVIASFAAGPNFALEGSLAAPMACPVLGDKSIIHRLRSLTMSDISPRRRFAGRAFLGAAVLALPLTASISYAESIAVPEAPVALASVSSVPAPPVPPAAPVAPEAPWAEDNAWPTPPAPPAPPAPLHPETGDGAHTSSRVVVIDKQVDGDGNKTVTERKSHKIFVEKGAKMSKEEREELRAELREAMADVDEAMVEAQIAITEAEGARQLAVAHAHSAQDGVTKVSVDCSTGKKKANLTSKDGKQVMYICNAEVMAGALSGLKEARKAIAKNAQMSGEMRAEVMAALDEKIADWENK